MGRNGGGFPLFVILNLVQDNMRRLFVILKQVQDDEGAFVQDDEEAFVRR